jgi:L-lactate dehydrogenase (cytochrome)
MIGKALNYGDIRALARSRLPRGLFEYIDRGAEDEVALAAMRAAWDRVKLDPSVLVDVSVRRHDTELFGQRIGLPVVIAPTALAGLVWYDGEVALALAAAKAGIPFCVSTQSVTPIERIATSGARLWFQLYVWRDRKLMYRLLDRARGAGAETLVLTVDTAVGPNREYNVRNGFGIPLQPSLRAGIDVLAHPRWLLNVFLRQLMAEGVPSYAHYPPEFKTRITRPAVADALRLDDRVSWADVAELRRHWRGPFLLKGILRVDDARRALEHGLDGIVVSSHGARNLDSARPSIDALPEIVAEVGQRMTVLVDSGVRRGSHIVKALALGAKAVLVGRATLYGTAVAGEAGATRMLDLLRDELDRTMGLIGRTTIASIGPDSVRQGTEASRA